MKKLNNSKAPGVCGITTEMLKAGGDAIVQWMTRVVNHVWVLEVPPEDWTKEIIIPFWLRASSSTNDSVRLSVNRWAPSLGTLWDLFGSDIRKVI